MLELQREMIFIVRPTNPHCAVIEIMIYSHDEGAREERVSLFPRRDK